MKVRGNMLDKASWGEAKILTASMVRLASASRYQEVQLQYISRKYLWWVSDGSWILREQGFFVCGNKMSASPVPLQQEDSRGKGDVGWKHCSLWSHWKGERKDPPFSFQEKISKHTRSFSQCLVQNSRNSVYYLTYIDSAALATW